VNKSFSFNQNGFALKYATVGKIQAMKSTLRHFRAFVLVCLTLALGACGSMPEFGWGQQKQDAPVFKPLGSDLAMLAAPQTAPPMTVFCKVGNGSAKFDKAYLDFIETGFSIGESDRRNVTLHPKKGSGGMKFQAIFDRGGQKLVFCPFKNAPVDQEISCASLYALDDDLQMGLKRTFDIPDAVMGASITCASDQNALLKL
jgi:hypothetical protein